MSIQKQLIELHLDYLNNFLTIDKFSEYYNLNSIHAMMLLNIGKELHEENAEFYKQFKQELYT
jgi:hypothetical protein